MTEIAYIFIMLFKLGNELFDWEIETQIIYIN